MWPFRAKGSDTSQRRSSWLLFEHWARLWFGLDSFHCVLSVISLLLHFTTMFPSATHFDKVFFKTSRMDASRLSLCECSAVHLSPSHSHLCVTRLPVLWTSLPGSIYSELIRFFLCAACFTGHIVYSHPPVVKYRHNRANHTESLSTVSCVGSCSLYRVSPQNIRNDSNVSEIKADSLTMNGTEAELSCVMVTHTSS